MTDTPYNATDWMAKATRAGRVFNYNYRMVGDELPGWDLVKTVEMGTGPDAREIAYIWQQQGSDGDVLLRIDVGEAPDWRHAQALLQGHLQHTMSPQLPGGAGEQAPIGDVAYTAREPDADADAAVFFSIGNVTLTVRSVGSRPVDVAPVARMLHSLLGEPPAADAPSPSRRVSRGPLLLDKDGSVAVVRQLAQPAARSGWVKLIAPAGEFHREDDSILFTATESGEQGIEEYRTGNIRE